MDDGRLPGAAGGDPVCWAHLVCPECGAVESEGHRTGCPLAEESASAPAPGSAMPEGQA